MNFGKINQFILFGGGRLLLDVSRILKHKGFKTLIVTSPRHAKEHLSVGDQLTLSDHLVQDKSETIISKDMNDDPGVQEVITPTTLGLSLGAAWIFKKKIIDQFNGRLMNCHGARLPKDRGGGGFSWRILRGDRRGCSLLHQISTGIDDGKIVKFQEYEFPKSCRLPIDYQKFSRAENQTLIDDFLNDIQQEKEFKLSEQVHSLSTYWPRLHTNIHGVIHWDWSVKDIENFICAFDDPYEGATTWIRGSKVRVKKCFSTVEEDPFHPFQWGLVYRISNDLLCVAGHQGSLMIHSLFDTHGNNMMGKVKVGDRFYSPIEDLEKARHFRAVYKPEGAPKDE